MRPGGQPGERGTDLSVLEFGKRVQMKGASCSEAPSTSIHGHRTCFRIRRASGRGLPGRPGSGPNVRGAPKARCTPRQAPPRRRGQRSRIAISSRELESSYCPPPFSECSTRTPSLLYPSLRRGQWPESSGIVERKGLLPLAARGAPGQLDGAEEGRYHNLQESAYADLRVLLPRMRDKVRFAAAFQSGRCPGPLPQMPARKPSAGFVFCLLLEGFFALHNPDPRRRWRMQRLFRRKLCHMPLRPGAFSP